MPDPRAEPGKEESECVTSAIFAVLVTLGLCCCCAAGLYGIYYLMNPADTKPDPVEEEEEETNVHRRPRAAHLHRNRPNPNDVPPPYSASESAYGGDTAYGAGDSGSADVYGGDTVYSDGGGKNRGGAVANGTYGGGGGGGGGGKNRGGAVANETYGGGGAVANTYGGGGGGGGKNRGGAVANATYGGGGGGEPESPYEGLDLEMYDASIQESGETPYADAEQRPVAPVSYAMAKAQAPRTKKRSSVV